MRAMLVLLALLFGWAVTWSAPRAETWVSLVEHELIRFALDMVHSPGSFEVEFGSIEDTDDGLTNLLAVRVSDGSGIWMTIERLGFAWRPNRLLEGELAISDLRILGATVLRAPAEEAEWPEMKPQRPWQRQLLDWPRAPIALALDRIRFERAYIKEGVFPQAIRFNAEGRMHDREEVQEIALVVKRIDGVTGEIAIETRRDFGADTFRLSLQAHEAEDGLVAAVAGFPTDVPARLLLSGEGPPDDWRLSFQAAVEGVFTADGQAAVDYANALAVDSKFTLRPGPLMNRNLRAMLGDNAGLTLALTERSKGQFDIAVAELRAAALSMRVKGSFSIESGRNDLAVSIEAEAPVATLVEELAFDHLTFDGTVTGSRGALEASGRLTVKAPESSAVSAARFEAEVTAKQGSAGTTLVLAGDADGLRLAHRTPAEVGVVGIRLHGILSDRRLVVEAADLRSGLISGKAKGHHNFAAATGQWTVSLETDELGHFAAYTKTILRGAATAHGDIRLAAEDLEVDLEVVVRQLEADIISAHRAEIAGRINRSGLDWVFEFTGSATDLGYPGVPRGLTNELDASFRGSLRDALLRVSALELQSPLLTGTAHGDVDLSAGRIDLLYGLRVPDAARLAEKFSQRMGGAVEASGRATGPKGDIEVAGTVTVSDSLYEGRSYGRIRLTHDVRISDTVTGKFDIAADGGWLNRVAVDASVHLNRDAWRLEDVKMDVAGLAVESNAVVISPETMLAEGAGTMTASDLRPLAMLAGIGASGTADGAFTLRAQNGRQSLASTLRLVQAEVSGFRMGQAVLHIAAEDLVTSKEFDLRLFGTSGAAGPLTIDAMDIRASGALAALDFSGSIVGHMAAHPANLVLEGQAAIAGNQGHIAVETSSASIGKVRAMLHSPVELRFDRTGERFQTTELDIGLTDGGRLSGTISRQADGLVGRLRGVGIPMAPLADLMELPLASGTLDLAVTLDKRHKETLAEIELNGRDLALDDAEAMEAVSVALSGRWDGARLDLNGIIGGGGFREPVAVQLALPVRAGRSGFPRLSERGPVGGTLSWRGKIADLAGMMPPSPHVVDGDVDLQLSIAGTVEAPRLSGRLDFVRGHYDHMDAGLGLVDVAIEASMIDGAVVRLKYSASDGGQGRVRGDATVRLDQNPTIDAVFRVNRAMLLQRDEITAWISGVGRLHGPWDHLALNGEFTVDQAEIRLIDAVPHDAVELDGVRLLRAPDEKIAAETSSLAAVDITVRAARNVFVRGRGLESEWSLNLRVTGDISGPVLSGAVDKVRGSLDLLGRPFELVRGELVFDGTAGMDPVIDVGLERESGDVYGGIYVDGRLSKPHVRFESRSGLPSDEVLPRLLFGVSQQSLTSLQALQLSLGIARLLGHGVGIQDRIRQMVGVDVLTVSGTIGEDAAVIAGQNLGDRVFVGAEQKIEGGQSTVLVEVTVADNVIVDSRMEAGQGPDIGLNWRHDY